jgi:hypothetical protein
MEGECATKKPAETSRGLGKISMNYLPLGIVGGSVYVETPAGGGGEPVGVLQHGAGGGGAALTAGGPHGDRQSDLQQLHPLPITISISASPVVKARINMDVSPCERVLPGSEIPVNKAAPPFTV